MSFEVHARRMRLHHGRVAVYVHYESGQEVPFAVHEAETVVVGAVSGPTSCLRANALCSRREKKSSEIPEAPNSSILTAMLPIWKCPVPSTSPAELTTTAVSPSSIPSGNDAMAPENTHGCLLSSDSSFPFSVVLSCFPLDFDLYQICEPDADSLHNAGYQRVSHQKGPARIRCALGMIVREHVESFKLDGDKPAVTSGFCLHHMFEP